MAFEHRATERKAKLEQLRVLARRIIEDAAAAQIAIQQVTLWGGPQAEDFNGDNAENAAARLTETVVGLSAANMMFAELDQTVGEYSVTVGEALKRIAAA